MATATLGQNGFPGRGRSPPRPIKEAAVNGGGLPRPCGLSSRPSPLEALFEEDGLGQRDGSKSPLWMSISSTLVLPTAEDLARFGGTKTPGRRSTGPLPPAQADVLEEEDDVAYYSEPEREVPISRTPKEFPRCETIGDLPSSVRPVAVAPLAPLPSPQRGRAAERAESSESMRSRLTKRAASDPRPQDLPDLGGQSRVHDACAVASAATSAAKSAAAAVTEKKSLEESAETNFLAWLVDELRSRPDEEQLPRIPRSHLEEVAKVPKQLEKLLLLGFLLCLDILLHELSFTPLQAIRSSLQLLLGFRQWGSWSSGSHTSATSGRRTKATATLSITEQGDFLRLSLLILNVTLILMIFDVSWMYHYIRGESFLKLYVLFNMLEMFERWCRSVGVDLFDLLLASARHPWYSLLPKYCATLVYCFVHATMHLIRVILLNVAINTSSNAVFLIIVTNNFAEIKSTVFKRYEEKSLFPIITSDIVERFYLLLDIIFVLARLSISQHSGTFTALDISFWLFLLVVLEIGTDWIKFCLITKFSEMQTKTFEVYREVLLADILLCRCGQLSSISQVTGQDFNVQPEAHGSFNKEGALRDTTRDGKDRQTSGKDRPAPVVPYRGIHSFSHVLQRRLGFSGVPMTTILVVHFVVLARAPCAAAVQHPRATVSVFAAAFFFVCLLAKILFGIVLLGFAARRRARISRGLELFPKIKSL
ncbi:unnamed protein product [Durusdinium trenchii]|uniref:Uncharacterized protein n=1 Tax=Durusdinium trenchii TaxID=1381693 RepID=A0ABP0LW77_9DINO